ncbi:MAG: hypothetical protein ACPH93_00630 [Candidatus Poseidoniaceae archaeon]
MSVQFESFADSCRPQPQAAPRLGRFVTGLLHAVAGHPVQASASPLLALLTVGRLEEAGVVGLGLATTRVVRIEATEPDRVFEELNTSVQSTPGVHEAVMTRIANEPRPQRSNPSRFIAGGGRWVSLTTPLKHQIGDWHCTDGAQALRSVNALRLDDDGVHSAGTDGLGVVALARLAGWGPDGGAVLRMRGGGGAARSVAHAWAGAGGRVHLVEGRRPLMPPLLNSDLAASDEEAVLSVDFDGEGQRLIARHRLNPSYQGTAFQAAGSLAAPLIDGRWMLVAQHLEAWRTLWAPELHDALPSIPELMEDLLAVEALLDGS